MAKIFLIAIGISKNASTMPRTRKTVETRFAVEKLLNTLRRKFAVEKTLFTGQSVPAAVSAMQRTCEPLPLWSVKAPSTAIATNEQTISVAKLFFIVSIVLYPREFYKSAARKFYFAFLSG